MPPTVSRRFASPRLRGSPTPTFSSHGRWGAARPTRCSAPPELPATLRQTTSPPSSPSPIPSARRPTTSTSARRRMCRRFTIVSGWCRSGEAMKTNSYRVGLLGVVLLLATALPERAHGQANRWINTADDEWEIGANWSAGVPNGTQSIFITNGVNSKTITVNNATVLSNALNSCMTVSNLIISAPSSFQNTLSLTNAGTSTEFVVRGTLTVSPRGSLTITNSILRVGVSGLGATTWTVDGTTTLNSGTIVSFAGCGLFCFVVRPTVIGSTSTGVFTVAGGRWGGGPGQLD